MLDRQSYKSWTPWVGCTDPNLRVQLRLFCFPYAGGGASTFRLWPDHLPTEVEVCPVQLPGRESRLMEPLFTRLAPLVHTLAKALQPHMTVPFAFFGHSMGALVSFELARYLHRQSAPVPAHLFLSGRRAAQIVDTKPHTYDLPEPAFLDMLRRLNGTTAEVLECEELMRLVLPILRADMEVCETYVYSHDTPLDCPISVFSGLQDPEVSYAAAAAWREQTVGPFAVHVLPGDHFFIHSARAPLIQVLSAEIARLVWCKERPPQR
jgi:medium-chain acyl-[acyl-carrier-protein] hydrolase